MPICTLRESISQFPDSDRVDTPVPAGKLSLVSKKSVDFRMDDCPSEVHSKGGYFRNSVEL